MNKNQIALNNFIKCAKGESCVVGSYDEMLLQKLVDKEEKYRWHDLTINSKDLPESKKRVLIYRRCNKTKYEYAIDYNANSGPENDYKYEVWESDLMGYTVLKWKYIDED